MDKLIKKIEELPVGHSVMTYERSIGSNAAEFKTDDLQTLVRRYKAMEEALKKADELIQICCPVSECLSGYLRFTDLPVDTLGANQMHQQFTQAIRAFAATQKALKDGDK